MVGRSLAKLFYAILLVFLMLLLHLFFEVLNPLLVVAKRLFGIDVFPMERLLVAIIIILFMLLLLVFRR